MNSNNSHPQVHNEMDLKRVVSIIQRRKRTLIYTTLTVLILVLGITFLLTPTYEARVILKKEKAEQREYRDEFSRRFSLLLTDEIDTELQIIRTRSVLEKVISELQLQVNIDAMQAGRGKKIKIDKLLAEYNNSRLSGEIDDPGTPKYMLARISPEHPGGEFFIQCKDSFFVLAGASGEDTLRKIPLANPAEINLPGMNLVLNWADCRPEDRLFFTVHTFQKTIKKLRKSIEINREGKTNIFTLSAFSPSPFMARLLANSIAEKYREARLEQKRENIHYSFSFVDDQLSTIEQKLQQAELDLSAFKSRNRLTILDESSRDLINTLSSFEAEEVRTELDLAEYQNKLKDFKKEVERRGFFDQTYLTPTNNNDTRTPFAVLLEQLSNAELRRLELLQKRKENHPDVISVNDQIEKIKEKLSHYNENTITSYQIIINALKKKQAGLKKLISEYGSKVEKLPGSEALLAELIRKKNVYEKMYNLLMDKREELRVAEYSRLQEISILERAALPTEPVSPRKKINAIMGLVLGLIFGFVVVFVSEFFEKRITSVEEVEHIYKLPILSIIPRYSRGLIEKIDISSGLEKKLVVLMNEQTLIRQSFGILRTKLIRLLNQEHQILMVTSCEANTGKTSTVANLAVSLAKIGKKTLVIDADLMNPTIESFFNIQPDQPGLIEYLSKDDVVPSLHKPFESVYPEMHFYILSAGKPGYHNPDELLNSEKMGRLINYLKPRFDIILVDTSPVTKTIEPIVLGKLIKQVLIVVQPDLTFKDSLAFALQEMKQFEMNVLGSVINSFNIYSTNGKYKYGYGYGYTYQSSRDKHRI